MADVPDELGHHRPGLRRAHLGRPPATSASTAARSPSAPASETEAEFIAAIRAKQAAGKKVLISIGGANGQVQLTTTAARDTFVSSVSAIIDRYGLDGLDIDFEGHSLSLEHRRHRLQATRPPR